LAAAAAVSIVASPARAAGADAGAGAGADASTEIMARERPATRSFYGWQILATGEAGGVLAAAATVLPDSPLSTLPSTLGFLFGMPMYILGGPATHWTHGEFHKGLISLGGNFALPVFAGLLGQAVRCSPSDAVEDCGARGFFTGFAIALVTVPLVDALVLGWEDVPDDDPVVRGGAAAADGARGAAHGRAAKRAARFTMTPAWSLGANRELAFGVAGRF
jgi:hypothetical protein